MRHTGHVVGERAVDSIDVDPLGVTIRRLGSPPVWVPLANVRWGEVLEPKPELRAVEGGQRGKRR
jgi:hypothetical protein